MSHSASHQPFPRGVLLGAAALVGLTIIAASAARMTGIGTTPNPTSKVVQVMSLRFEDRSNGAVAVYRAGEDREVGVLAPGTNGFIRSVLRGLARERRSRGIGPEPAFDLTRWADGRLSLDDPATGRTVELGAFGSANSGAFLQFMTAGGLEANSASIPEGVSHDAERE